MAVITLWPTLVDVQNGQSCETPWSDVFDRMDAAGLRAFRGDTAHPGWSAARLLPLQRADANVQALTALVLDYDGAHAIEDAIEMWGQFLGYIHTTRKHTNQSHRFRVVLPLSREVSPDEYRLIWTFFVRVSGHRLDEVCKDVSRFWYLPGPLPGHPFKSERLTGIAVDPDAFLPLANDHARDSEPPPKVTRFNNDYTNNRLGRYILAAVERECDRVSSAAKGTRNDTLNKAAFALGQLVSAGYISEDAATNALNNAARECGLKAFESRKTVQSGLRAGKKEPRQIPDSVLDPERRTTIEYAPDRLKVSTSGKPENDQRPGPFDWRSTAAIFEPLPPVPWISRDLQLAPGRPAMIAGYGSSAKTLSAQALALAVATGTPAWGRFETQRGVVRHLDYEQGWRATARRYQRLTIGHGLHPEDLGDRLQVAAFPSVYLDSPDAVDAYSKASEGAQLIILDALRGSAPSQDENDSSIRVVIDNLSRVSEKTGVLFLVLHHAGKPKDTHEADKRTVLRGSSAIFDAAGCVFVMTAGETPEAPRRVDQTKPPAEAEGASIKPFELYVEDVLWLGDPTAGLRVVHRAIEQIDPAERTRLRNALDSNELLKFVARNPDLSQRQIIARSGFPEKRTATLLRVLEDDGLIEVREGAQRAKVYRFVGGQEYAS